MPSSDTARSSDTAPPSNTAPPSETARSSDTVPSSDTARSSDTAPPSDTARSSDPAPSSDTARSSDTVASSTSTFDPHARLTPARRASRSVTHAVDSAASTPGARLAARLHLAQPPTLRLRDADGAWLLTPSHAAEWRYDRYAIVIDLAHRQLRRAGATPVDLGARDTLFALLATLAARPGELVDAATLTHAAWQLDYHPLRHHSRLTTTLSRLRTLVGADAIEGTRAGYRLLLPAPWAILETR